MTSKLCMDTFFIYNIGRFLNLKSRLLVTTLCMRKKKTQRKKKEEKRKLTEKEKLAEKD